MDLSVPRCIDPGVSNLPGVRLFNLDDLASTPTEQNRTEDLAHARAIVEEETQAFLNWMRERRVAPVITRLHRRAARIRRLELEKTLRRLRTLPERDRQLIERLSIAIVNKILHEPTVRLKENALQGDGALLVAMERLFGLDGSPRE